MISVGENSEFGAVFKMMQNEEVTTTLSQCIRLLSHLVSKDTATKKAWTLSGNSSPSTRCA